MRCFSPKHDGEMSAGGRWESEEPAADLKYDPAAAPTISLIRSPRATRKRLG